MVNFVVLSSSRGTTFQAVLDRIKDRSLSARCLGLVTDSSGRGCIEKARAAGLPVIIVERKKNEHREEYDERLHHTIMQLINENNQQLQAFIACIGWMWILTPPFIRKWKNRIFNVHPSLLPRHPGAHAHEEVLRAGEKESGMTIHLIDEGVDTGRILLQKSCPVLPGDTPETLRARVQELEREWYPRVLQMLEEGTMSLE